MQPLMLNSLFAEGRFGGVPFSQCIHGAGAFRVLVPVLDRRQFTLRRRQFRKQHHSSIAGSPDSVSFGQQVLRLTVPETGGFQQFQPQSLGRYSFPSPGRYRLEVRAISKPGVAVMDLREVRMTPAE